MLRPYPALTMESRAIERRGARRHTPLIEMAQSITEASVGQMFAIPATLPTFDPRALYINLCHLRSQHLSQQDFAL